MSAQRALCNDMRNPKKSRCESRGTKIKSAEQIITEQVKFCSSTSSGRKFYTYCQILGISSSLSLITRTSARHVFICLFLYFQIFFYDFKKNQSASITKKNNRKKSRYAVSRCAVTPLHVTLLRVLVTTRTVNLLEADVSVDVLGGISVKWTD